MSNAAQAAIVAAGTAVVLAPIDPQALRDSEPAPAPKAPTCRAILLAHAELTLTDRVRTALGMPGRQKRENEGETARRVGVWSQYELNAVYAQVGGTVTTRTVQRSTYGDESTWEATEITLTVALPGIGTVEVFTDWYEEYGGRDLPLMQAVAGVDLLSA